MVVMFLGLLLECVNDISSVGMFGCSVLLGFVMMLVVVIVLMWLLKWCCSVGVRYWLMKVELFVLVRMMCRWGLVSSGVRNVLSVVCCVLMMVCMLG